MKKVELIPLLSLPLVKPGDDISSLIANACQQEKISLRNNDIIVIAQKIISKAENALVDLKTVIPSEKASEIASQTGRDPRLVQVYLDESSDVLYVKGRAVVTRHRSGMIMSSSGVDRSNVAEHAEGIVVLLPRDCDRSAQNIREGIRRLMKKKTAVIISDSGGRSDRKGSIGTAIGLAGIAAVEQRDQKDLFGNPTKSEIALVDELAAAASMLMGQADEMIPVVIVRGVMHTVADDVSISDILN